MLDIDNLQVLPFVPFPLPYWMPKKLMKISDHLGRYFIIPEMPRTFVISWAKDPDTQITIIEHKFEHFRSRTGKRYYISKEGWILSDIGIFFGVFRILTAKEMDN